MQGGLILGMMYDICGESASGKTQLCSTIAINLAKNFGIGTIYINSNRDFWAIRLYRILSASGSSVDDSKEAMECIRSINCDDSFQLIELLDELIAHIEQFKEKYRLLVIDSLPALWYTMHGVIGMFSISCI